MLVFARKVGERIMIGGGIIITVVEIDRNKVRIGVDAPMETPIDREEVYQRKIKEGRHANDQ